MLCQINPNHYTSLKHFTKKITMSDPILKIYKNKTELIEMAADLFVEKAQVAIKKKERFVVCLSGGKTPKALYELLATEPYREKINWKKCYVFWGDERMVPPNHDESNYGMAYDTLLKKVNIPKSQIFPVDTSKTPKRASELYSQALLKVFRAKRPSFDLFLLGMGADGHTASIFPGTDAVHIRRKRVKGVYVSALKTWRMTMTFPVINNARTVAFLVIGRKKAVALKEVLKGDYNPNLYPAQLVRKAKGEVIWFLDNRAASQL